MSGHLKTFTQFLQESHGYDRFMQQAQVAQSGNPYWFGLNPKKSKKSKTKKQKL